MGLNIRQYFAQLIVGEVILLPIGLWIVFNFPIYMNERRNRSLTMMANLVHHNTDHVQNNNTGHVTMLYKLIEDENRYVNAYITNR